MKRTPMLESHKPSTPPGQSNSRRSRLQWRKNEASCGAERIVGLHQSLKRQREGHAHRGLPKLSACVSGDGFPLADVSDAVS